jgi:PTS system nitrogen regulatory IIA component
VELSSLVSVQRVFDAVPGKDRGEALRAVAGLLAPELRVSPDLLSSRLLEREALGSTALGGGVAIPHCKLDRLAEVVVAIARLDRPVDYLAPDGEPVRLLVVVLSPADTPAAHLRALAMISRWLKDPKTVPALLAAAGRDAMLQLVPGFGVPR